MKTSKFCWLALVLLMLNVGVLYDQHPKVCSEGSVWGITMVRVKTGMGDEYQRSLNSNLKKIYDEARKQGLMMSYKILSGDANGQGDWDMLIMTEFKNMAALDGLDDKMDAIQMKMVGTEDVQKKLMMSRVDMRDIIGTKLMRELGFKP